ncbi:MAG: tRNA uridine-5-carboxymethylaminomethyl(34) synthesis GTPase MnmE [Sphaerochaetaceae bacterium]|nr:tRNA uridine-5-carboxymethylaminomethyl(34) synthesis GTPase MnmE [Sphaerochaetaceae bacterium]
MREYVTDDIIYALATPWAQSALAVIRVSGEGCKALLATRFSRPKALKEAGNATLVHGYLQDEAGKKLDEVVAAVYTEGHGYTLEEAIEFSCHGSLAVIKEILALFSRLGMRSAEGGEFTFRAFLHGRLDLTQAEAVQELVVSQSERSRALALGRLEGSLKERISSLKQQLMQVMAAVEVQLDYAEDELDAFVFPRAQLVDLITQLHHLSETYQVGKLYKSGARIVLAGSTNAGKSSLFNLLLKQERSIVSPVKGTTRDYIEADLSIEGIPIRLYDTAGLRESSDSIESEGIKRTERLIGQADLVVFLVDSTMMGHVPEEDERTLVVYNKSDLARPPKGKLAISAQSGEGVDRLLHEISTRLTSGFSVSGDELLIIESERQYQLLDASEVALGRALELVDEDIPLDITAVELGEALDNLGQLTGEVTPSDILETIFSGFCVGK